MELVAKLRLMAGRESSALYTQRMTLNAAADEIERLRTALELIACGTGGIPAPRLFARDVLDGNIILMPTQP